VLRNWLCLGRRPGNLKQITQLEAPWAIHVILQTGSGELELSWQKHVLLRSEQLYPHMGVLSIETVVDESAPLSHPVGQIAGQANVKQ
jgi:hypothetical protein